MTGQQQLETGVPRVRPTDDFLYALPGKVMPTPIRVLEQNGNLLVVRHYDYGQKIAPVQDRMWHTMVQFGRPEDSPGTVTVLCIMGLTGTRPTVEYSAAGKRDYVWGQDEIRAYVKDWWRSAS